MSCTLSFCLRILLWLLMLADGEDNEGNAVRFPSFHPTSRQRLMTDNFLPVNPSARSIPFSGVIGYQGAAGPNFHGNGGLDQQMETPKSSSSSRFHAMAIYPGYGTGRPATFGQGSTYGQSHPSSLSPFRNLFGNDIGRPSGIEHSIGSPRREINAFGDTRNDLPMGKPDFQSYRNHPFSSLRLTPITKVSGVAIAGPKGQSNVIGNNNQWAADRNFNGALGGNRAHSFDHENPFEKPISRSAFPLPSVNDPISLDLAQDERKRVKYAKETKRLPPPRNFVYKPKPENNEGSGGNYNPETSGKAQGPLNHDFSADPFAKKRLTSISIPELPSEKKSFRKQNGLAPIQQEAKEVPESRTDGHNGYREDGDIDLAIGSESSMNLDEDEAPDPDDRNVHPVNSAGILTDTMDKNGSGKELLISNSETRDLPSIHAHKDQDRQEEERRHNTIETSDSSKGGYDMNHDYIMDSNIIDDQIKSEEPIQNFLSVESEENPKLVLPRPRENRFPQKKKEHPIQERPGVYDVTTLTQETIKKQSGKFPDNVNVTNDLSSIPATKRIIEETIESGKRTLVNNETNLPTDHVGFILTDQLYDENDQDKTSTTSSVIEQQGPSEGVSNDLWMRAENANEEPSDIDFVDPDPDSYVIFTPDFGTKENHESEIISNFQHVDSLDSHNSALARPPIGSGYLLHVLGGKDSGTENTIEESEISASSNGARGPQNHFSDNILSAKANEFDERANDIQINGHTLSEEDSQDIGNDVIHPQKLSLDIPNENGIIAKNNNQGESSNNFKFPTPPQNETNRLITMLTKDTASEPITEPTPELETVPLRLGVMKEGDVSISDRQSQKDNHSYVHDGIQGDPADKATHSYLRTTDERQQITLDNMNQYLEGENNKSNDSRADSFQENIDENGLPNFSRYSYDNYGPTRGDDFSPMDFDSNDDTDDSFSVDTDPTSLEFDVLKAGEGSLSIRKVSNTFDPDHEDVNTVKASLATTEESDQTTEPAYYEDHYSETSEEDNGKADTDVPATPVYEEFLSSEGQPNTDREKDPDTSSNEDSDSDDEYEDLFRPASSYEQIDFPKPSPDAFSSSSSAFDDGESSLDSSSLLLSTPFQSMFGKTVDQAEKDSFGSLFQNLQNADHGEELAGTRGKGSTVNLQDSGLFGGSLFDERLGQIVESRPSLDLFGKKRRK